MRHFINHTEENYLKAILHLSDESDSGVSTNAIAKVLNTKPSSVTDMIKKLADKQMVSYKKYYGVNLTSEGRVIAINTLRKHRLWEVFLVEKLSFSWDEVHEIAEQLEHIQSPELTNRLDDFLGNPKYDPHGDPIPNKDGEINDYRSSISLSEAELNKSYVVIGVADSSTEFLNYLESNGLTLGAQVMPLRRHSFDSSMNIIVNNENMNLSERVIKNLKVNENS